RLSRPRPGRDRLAPPVAARGRGGRGRFSRLARRRAVRSAGPRGLGRASGLARPPRRRREALRRAGRAPRRARRGPGRRPRALRARGLRSRRRPVTRALKPGTLAALLAAAILFVWGPLLWAPFVYDDGLFVLANPDMNGPWPGLKHW